MIQDTRAINSDRSDIETLDEIWLFGYGSLIYKVDFPYLESKPAYLSGWSRRFWQGSHDHRGTPDKPGRVLTLIEAPSERCFGIAYKVTADVFDHLDHREKNGYLRLIKELEFEDGTRKPGVTYIGMPNNPAFLGPAPNIDIAKQIHTSEGPSGTNREYVELLAEALKTHNVKDPQVDNINVLLQKVDKNV